MEIEDQECKFPLDQLPELIIDKIAWFLSNRDLAACCAVSRGVREAFDIECVWRPRYDADRAEYLLKTPCKVQPIFESPENTNNDLSAISQSRLAFMAENHLWNNWRQGNFTTELFTRKRLIHKTFVIDDCVASIGPDCIVISDVRYSPASHAFDPISMLLDPQVRVASANDKIIVMYNCSVQVLHLDTSTNQWVLKHSFFIDEAEQLSDDMTYKSDCLKMPRIRGSCTYTLTDHFIVGVVEFGDTMHIWNFETGVKIKTELCPVKDAAVHQILATSSKDLILAVQQGKQNSLLLAYSLPRLKFLAFRQPVQGTYFDGEFNCIVHSNFISVCCEDKLNTYDYQNCQVKLLDHPIDYFSSAVPLGKNVLFLEGNSLKLFNPCTSKMQSFGDGIKDFLVLCNRFVIIERCPEETTFELIELDENCGKISKKITSLNDLICFLWDECCSVSEIYIEVNKHSARAITKKFLWNFW